MAVFNFNNIRIAGMACVVPKNIVHPDDYKDRFGDEDVEKFKKMTGIRSSHQTSKFQTASDLCFTAADHLLREKGIDRSEIGALVMGTHSPDYRRPASSFIVHKRLRLSTETAVFDLALGCSSVVYGIQVVSSMMVNSDNKKALLVSGDTGSKTLNPMDKASLMLCGECGIAILLEKTEDKEDIKAIVRSNGEGYRYLIVPGGGYRYIDAPRDEFVCKDGITRTLHDSFMMGTSVFTFTVFDVPKIIRDFLQMTQTSVDDYDCFAFHHANLYILKQIAKKVKIPEEKMPLTLPDYGNTSGASPVLTLCDTYGDSKDDRILNVLMIAFGVGLSWGISSFHINARDILPIIEDDSVFEEGIIHSPEEL